MFTFYSNNYILVHGINVVMLLNKLLLRQAPLFNKSVRW